MSDPSLAAGWHEQVLDEIQRLLKHLADAQDARPEPPMAGREPPVEPPRARQVDEGDLTHFAADFGSADEFR